MKSKGWIMKKKKTLYITDCDMNRLKDLVNILECSNTTDRQHVVRLTEELDRAEVIPAEAAPASLITMNSRVWIRDLDTGEEKVLTLVYPQFADIEDNKISVLAPIGTALLGYQVGDTVEEEVPAGKRSLKVKRILYQPESAGESELKEAQKA
jgi:regulator of nucleoside diphosphate kinase